MKILVPLDGSHFAEAVIGPVAKLANDSNAQVVLVHVVDPSGVHSTSAAGELYQEITREEFSDSGIRVTEVSDTLGGPRVVESLDQALDRLSQEGRDYLSHVAVQFAPIQPESVVLLGRDVDEELLKFATGQHIDMIAMSTHGRTGLARMILGSHAENIMRSGAATVLMVRPDDLHIE